MQPIAVEIFNKCIEFLPILSTRKHFKVFFLEAIIKVSEEELDSKLFALQNNIPCSSKQTNKHTGKEKK